MSYHSTAVMFCIVHCTPKHTLHHCPTSSVQFLNALSCPLGPVPITQSTSVFDSNCTVRHFTSVY